MQLDKYQQLALDVINAVDYDVYKEVLYGYEEDGEMGLINEVAAVIMSGVRECSCG